jgi:hypothetical protein
MATGSDTLGWDESGERRARGGWPSSARLGVVALLFTLCLCAVAPAIGGTGGAGSAGVSGEEECVPSIVMLSTPTVTASAMVTAMNRGGLVGGTSWDWEEDVPSYAVVWRHAGSPTELGIGGVVRPDGNEVSGSVVDVNEVGVVAAQRYVFSPRGRPLAAAAMLWDETTGTTTKLPVPAQRPRAVVRAVNDLGVAVGSAYGRDKREVPVYWRDGQVTPLPIPPKASYGYAVDNNNRGLIVGVVVRDEQTSLPWWWRRGGRSGRLSTEGLRSEPVVVAVDDRERIVGVRYLANDNSRSYLWRGPSDRRPRPDVSPGGVAGMDDAGHLVGASGGFRGFDDRAWVARLRGGDSAHLPDPPLETPQSWWDNTFGTAVEGGVTTFAPQGGLTVGGWADDERRQPVLWTCAQTYFE